MLSRQMHLELCYRQDRKILISPPRRESIGYSKLDSELAFDHLWSADARFRRG